MSELEKLKAQNAELNDRIAKLEKAAEPPKPFVPRPMPRRDLTEGMSMDRATMLEFARAAGSTAAEDLRAFQQQKRSQSPPAEPQRQRGSGWRDEAPLGSPPGVELADRLMDHQDKIDRAELIERELKLAKARMGKGDAE
ncbi:MAG: hypothetical protein WCD78_25975 [Pseudolabrys sp.]|jgi:hypothetical protein